MKYDQCRMVPIMVKLHIVGILWSIVRYILNSRFHVLWLKLGQHKPFRVRRRSALSGLRDVRNSARLVNMR